MSKDIEKSHNILNNLFLKIMMKDIIKNFNPAWFASIMGTGIIPISVVFIDFPFKLIILRALIIFIIILFFIFFVPLILKLIFYFNSILKDLNHPIIANFFPTIPISLIIIALNLFKYPNLIYNIPAKLILYLWIFGVIGIYLFNFIITSNVFSNKEIEYSHANFGWFIPPVSALVIPVIGFELSKLFPHDDIIFIISTASLGVGFFLFIFVGANVYHRYIYHELPMDKLAPTLFIGLTPTSVITIIIFKMLETEKISLSIGKLLMISNWGLSCWWFLMAVFIMIHYIYKLNLSYALSWWAFTFPTGAFVVATGLVWQITGSNMLHFIYIVVLIFFIVIWVIVLFKTAIGLKKILLQEH